MGNYRLRYTQLYFLAQVAGNRDVTLTTCFKVNFTYPVNLHFISSISTTDPPCDSFYNACLNAPGIVTLLHETQDDTYLYNFLISFPPPSSLIPTWLTITFAFCNKILRSASSRINVRKYRVAS